MSSFARMTIFPNLPDPDRDSQFYEGVPSKRLTAWIIDFLIITVFTLVASVAIGILTFGFGFALMPMIFFGTSFFYRTLTIASQSSTWGMRMMGIELRRQDGHRLDPATAAIHTGIFMLLMASVIGWIISSLAIVSTRYNQGLPDLFLGTTAINTPMD